MKIDYALENLKGDRTYTRNDLIEIFRNHCLINKNEI